MSECNHFWRAVDSRRSQCSKCGEIEKSPCHEPECVALQARIEALTLNSDALCMELLDKDKRIEALEVERRWIPVGERLPSNNDRVLVTNAHGHMTLSNCTHFGKAFSWSIGTVKEPTHWMPLPEPPQQEVNHE